MITESKVFNDLATDVLFMIVSRVAQVSPAPRAVCKEWRSIVDQLLSQREVEMCAMLDACRFRVMRHAPLPLHWLLAYMYPGTQPLTPRYHCAGCYRPVHALGTCESCLATRTVARQRRQSLLWIFGWWRRLVGFFDSTTTPLALQ